MTRQYYAMSNLGRLTSIFILYQLDIYESGEISYNISSCSLLYVCLGGSAFNAGKADQFSDGLETCLKYSVLC